MQKIKLLSQKEILKIAAGQVVDRPANIVKELIENSVDAGATKITVYIQDGGKELIRVVDDGCGMSQADARFCFIKHSTSKITNLDELSTGQATTFGFRGEALASISAVSKITLMTKDADSQSGISLELENGDFVDEKDIPFEQGTDLKIKDLFYNTPARQKFLKKRESENRHITQLFQAFCLDYLDITFKLFVDGRQTINCPTTDCLIKRAAQIWDHSFSENLVLVGNKVELEKQESINPNTGEITNSGTVIYGAITNHQYYRYDRNNIFLFVNKRWVKNHEIQSALLKGYINVLPAARYPAAFIFVETDPAEIDVNTHPRKEEVKFLHPRIITNKLQEIVKSALQENLSSQIKRNVTFKTEPDTQPSLWTTRHNFEQREFSSAMHEREENYLIQNSQNLDFYNSNYPSVNSQPSPKASAGTAWRTEEKKIFDTNMLVKNEINLHEQNSQYTPEYMPEDTHENKSQDTQEHKPQINNLPASNSYKYNIIGQYNKTYILIEKENGIFFIDQHAAHERILYEIFSKRFENVATIRLLFPQLITLKEEDIATLEPNLDVFKQNGIELEVFGENQVKIQATPVHIKNINLQELILEVISWIQELQELDALDFFKKINEKMHAQMACKAAIKAGDALTNEQMQKLLQDLEITENRFACPHGRPTGWILTLDEIEKKFRRKL